MWMRLVLLAAAALFAITACETTQESVELEFDENGTATDDGFTRVGGRAPKAKKKREIDNVHNVACGCTLGLKHQNMVEIDGKYVRLVSSGSQTTFCGKKDLKAKVKGELRDGAFYPTYFHLIRSN